MLFFVYVVIKNTIITNEGKFSNIWAPKALNYESELSNNYGISS